MRAALALAVAAAVALASGARAQDETPPLPHPGWSFSGVFGTYDRAALQRGFQVYSEVCANCHSVKLLHYRDLAALGYDQIQIEAVAAQKQVTAGPNDQGEMFQRPGQPSDAFIAPFPNDQAAKVANNGAVPPDLSLIVKAREGGEDYIYGVLTGYKEAPANVKVPEGMSYNLHFPGHMIPMPQPLSDDAVTYADGTKATVDQEAHDVVTFLTWAAEPKMEDRKRIGAKTMLFLLVMTGVLYGAKRKIWADLH
ncbi:MAG TPA: cytochrome c1 [Stellaceae bacterium]|nr:cytochrome c1 [Stellaceae bacterium]